MGASGTEQLENGTFDKFMKRTRPESKTIKSLSTPIKKTAVIAKLGMITTDQLVTK